MTVSILLYGRTTWTLMKCIEKNLDENYTKMLFLLYSRNTNISRNIIKHNIRTSMNEWIHFFIKILSLTLYSRKGDGCFVWEMSWRQGQTAILTQVLLTIAALLSHLGWVAQLWVTEGRKALSLQAGSHTGILSQTVRAPGYIIF